MLRNFTLAAFFVTRVFLFLCAVFLGAAAPVLATGSHSSDDLREVRQLHWQGGVLHLDTSHVTVSQPPRMIMVRGSDAAKFDRITNGSADTNIEAVSIDTKSGDTVYFQYVDSGYVKADDWTSINTGQMLQGIKDNTEQANAERQSHGMSPLHVTGWLEKPTYDKATDTVRWSLNASSSGREIFNAVALILGRHGYQELTWVGDSSEYRSRGGLLDQMILADHFDKGSRYQDYANGDKIAEVGLAALVGTVAGATLAKTGFFVGLLLVLKKFFILIIAAIIGGFRWLKSKLAGPFARQQ